MRRILLAAMALLVFLPAPAALAEHGTNTVFLNSLQGVRWVDSASTTHDLCVGDSFNSLPAQKFNDAVSSMREGIARWRADTQLDSNFRLNFGCIGEADFTQRYTAAGGSHNAMCNNLPSFAVSWITFEEFQGVSGLNNALGAAISCNLQGASGVDQLFISFNKSLLEPGNALYDWNGNTPANGNWDFLGLFMHEFGHALGIDQGVNGDGHFTEGGGSCPENVGRQTMCPGDLGFVNFGPSPGTWNRSLGTHDIGIANEEY